MMKLIPANEVAQILGYSYDYFQRVVKNQSTFPKPIKLTPKAQDKWRDIDIDNYLERLAA
jgi:predicted DNA-binding transcriptional regulator AlpA